MTRGAHLDCSTTGVSGDKFLAAAIAAGAPVDVVRGVLDSLQIGVSLEVSDVMRGGMRALKTEIVAPADPPHRSLLDIREILRRAELPEGVHDISIAAFERLAEAEAHVHGVDIEEIHFHEVGAADAIGEIVGVAAAVNALGIQELTISPVAVGSGCVECEHGTLPVPAPATAELLLGVPISPGVADGELTTPTGAALAATLATRFGAMSPMKVSKVGVGAGTRELPTPNIARLFVGEIEATARERTVADAGDGVRREDSHESVVLLSTTVDHISGEKAAFALDRLVESGALDAWLSQVLMRKGRPGLLIEAIARPDMAEALASAMMRETGTLGVRFTDQSRVTGARHSITVATEWGPVRVKSANAGGVEQYRAEMEDCERIARENGLSLDQVAAIAESTARASAESST